MKKLIIFLAVVILVGCFHEWDSGSHKYHQYYDKGGFILNGKQYYIFGCLKEDCKDWVDTFPPIPHTKSH